MIATKTEPMSKRAKVKTATIRVTERVARMIDVICSAEQSVSSSDVASPILEDALRERYDDAIDVLNKERAKFKKELGQ